MHSSDKSILVGIDFSPSSEQALTIAVALAKQMDAELANWGPVLQKAGIKLD